MEGQFVLRELYEQCYGIADHYASNNPMEIVLKQTLEDTKLDERAQNLIDQFSALDIYQTFGVSYVEFKKMSTRESGMLMISANDKKERMSKQAKKLERETKT